MILVFWEIIACITRGIGIGYLSQCATIGFLSLGVCHEILDMCLFISIDILYQIWYLKKEYMFYKVIYMMYKLNCMMIWFIWDFFFVKKNFEKNGYVIFILYVVFI